MKLITTKQIKHYLVIFLCFVVVGCLFLYLSGYSHASFLSVFNVLPIDKYETRSELLMEAMDEMGVCSSQKAAITWAKGLKLRSAALQYSVMTKELKKKYAEQLDDAYPNWVTGISSPWIDQFAIVKAKDLDDEIVYTISFSTRTSTGRAGEYYAVITVVRQADFWRIKKIRTDKALGAYTGYTD